MVGVEYTYTVGGVVCTKGGESGVNGGSDIQCLKTAGKPLQCMKAEVHVYTFKQRY